VGLGFSSLEVLDASGVPADQEGLQRVDDLSSLPAGGNWIVARQQPVSASNAVALANSLLRVANSTCDHNTSALRLPAVASLPWLPGALQYKPPELGATVLEIAALLPAFSPFTAGLDHPSWVLVNVWEEQTLACGAQQAVVYAAGLSRANTSFPSFDVPVVAWLQLSTVTEARFVARFNATWLATRPRGTVVRLGFTHRFALATYLSEPVPLPALAPAAVASSSASPLPIVVAAAVAAVVVVAVVASLWRRKGRRVLVKPVENDLISGALTRLAVMVGRTPAELQAKGIAERVRSLLCQPMAVELQRVCGEGNFGRVYQVDSARA
jgi:hypothetical protein